MHMIILLAVASIVTTALATDLFSIKEIPAVAIPLFMGCLAFAFSVVLIQ